MPHPTPAPSRSAAPVDAETAEKLKALEAYFAGLGGVIVCYSGGVDSAFVLAAAHRALGARAVALTAVSPSLATAELEDAVRVAKDIGADHRLVESQEIDDPDYQRNGPDRCFYCKSELYKIAAQKSRDWGIEHVVNGTNIDDLGDYRPGLEAASRSGVRSPLVELGFTKAMVRSGASALGLEIWDKPAAACLSSRIPFGTSVTRERLDRVGRYEASLKALGLRQVRVRYHELANPSAGDADAVSSNTEPAKAMARIELDASDLVRAASPGLREEIVRAGKEAGFAYITLDLLGYRMGSHNEVLGRRALPIVS